MARTHFIWPYLKAVGRHWVWLVVAAVGAVGNAATLFGDFVVPRWVWWSVVAVGVLVAQFLAYADVAAELGTANASLRRLDTLEAKRAYIDEAIEDAKRLRGEIRAVPEDGFDAHPGPTFDADIIHWEDGVRAVLRRHFVPGTSLTFDSDEGFEVPSPFGPGGRIAYLERRIARLREIKERL
jgi:hypothetical protein